MEIGDILNTVQEKGNMGGIWTNVLFAPQDDFLTLADKPTTEDNPAFADRNKLSKGTDVLKAGKRLYSLYTTMEKGSLVATRQGEFDGTSHKITLKVFVPGMEGTALGLLSVPNMNWIFYVRSGDKMFRVGGNKFPAKLAPEGDTGTGDATASAKGSELSFVTYDDGPAGEVVNIAAIEAMKIAQDADLTLVFDPAHGDTGELTSVAPTITYAKAIINADTLAAFTAQELESIIQLRSMDVDGNYVASVSFTAGIAGNVITVTPAASLTAATIYEVRIDSTKVLASDTKLRATGSNYARFTTA